MDKRAALDALRAAAAAHLKWRAYAQALVVGVDVSEDKVPLSHTDCAFGRNDTSETLLKALDLVKDEVRALPD